VVDGSHHPTWPPRHEDPITPRDGAVGPRSERLRSGRSPCGRHPGV